MRHSALFACLAASFLCGCVKIKSDFRPAIQRDPVPGQITAPRLSVLSMTDPKASYQFLGDIDTVLASAAWRWTGRNPGVRLLVPRTAPVKLVIEATLPEAVFKESGPVNAAIAIDGKPFDNLRFTSPSQQKFSRQVPEGWLRPGESVEVTMTLDNGLTNPKTHRFYGLQLTRVALEQ